VDFVFHRFTAFVFRRTLMKRILVLLLSGFAIVSTIVLPFCSASSFHRSRSAAQAPKPRVRIDERRLYDSSVMKVSSQDTTKQGAIIALFSASKLIGYSVAPGLDNAARSTGYIAR
jgi:hypothetical protein